MSAGKNKKLPSTIKIKQTPSYRRLPRSMKLKNLGDETSGIILSGDTYHGLTFMGIRDTKKVTALFAEIEQHEKAALKLMMQTARAYYDAGNILAVAIRNFNYKAKSLTAKAIADASGFSERRITLALKIFKHFEHNPEALNGLALRDALKLIAPPPPAGEEGYNRLDLGGDPGQLRLDFEELFEVPAVANQTLQNYRTVGEQVDQIIVVYRTKDNHLTSKRMVQIFEDIPQNKLLRHEYITMSQKMQAAVEDYLAALEREEAQNGC